MDDLHSRFICFGTQLICLMFAHLLLIGTLDEQTKSMMNAPRCGNRDRVGHSEDARRRKRYALQGQSK